VKNNGSSWSLTTPATPGTIPSSLGSLLALSSGINLQNLPSQKISPDQVDHYRRAFDEFDLDGDGKISTQELHLAFRRVGLNPTEGEVQDIINQYDMDGNGDIEWEEFVHVLASKLDPEDENYFKETFRVFSKNDEGCIPAEEMKFVLSQVCSVQIFDVQEAEEMLNVVDRNGDGVISYSEFRCMMGANPILL